MYMYMHVCVGQGSEIALWPLFPKQTQSPLCWLSDLTCPTLWGFYCTLQTTSGIDIGGFWRSVYNVSSQILPLKPKKSHDNGPGTEAGLLLISIWHSVVPVWSHKKLIHVATPMVVAQPLRQERKRERQRHIMWGWQTDGIPKGGDRTSCLSPRGTTYKPVSTLEGWETAGHGQEWWLQSLRWGHVGLSETEEDLHPCISWGKPSLSPAQYGKGHILGSWRQCPGRACGKFSPSSRCICF